MTESTQNSQNNMPKIKISGLKFRSIIQILGFDKLKFKKNHSKKTKVFWGLGYGEGQQNSRLCPGENAQGFKIHFLK